MQNNELVFEPAVALADIVTQLDKLHIEYYLVGSFASGIRGEFRATNDIDLVAKLNRDDSLELIKNSKDKFFCDDDAILTAVQDKRSFNIIHIETMIKIDFFTKVEPFEEDQFNKATKIVIPGFPNTKVNVSTTEYNVLAKLRWFLKGNRQSERQIRDVKSLIKINKQQLDINYLNMWVKELNLQQVFNEIIEDKI